MSSVGESGAGVAFGGVPVFVEQGESVVVGLDGFVTGLKREDVHGLARRYHGRHGPIAPPKQHAKAPKAAWGGMRYTEVEGGSHSSQETEAR